MINSSSSSIPSLPDFILALYITSCIICPKSLVHNNADLLYISFVILDIVTLNYIFVEDKNTVSNCFFLILYKYRVRLTLAFVREVINVI